MNKNETFQMMCDIEHHFAVKNAQQEACKEELYISLIKHKEMLNENMNKYLYLKKKISEKRKKRDKLKIKIIQLKKYFSFVSEK